MMFTAFYSRLCLMTLFSRVYCIFIKVFTNCIFLCLVTRIIRVIAQPRGNMLLIGIGGSGRQSLSRLSAYIIGFKVFQIEVTKHYRKNEFREGMYWKYVDNELNTMRLDSDTRSPSQDRLPIGQRGILWPSWLSTRVWMLWFLTRYGTSVMRRSLRLTVFQKEWKDP